MRGPLAIPETRLIELGQEVPRLNDLAGEPFVFGSSVLSKDPSGADFARFSAVVDTLTSSKAAGVPHLVMLDDASHSDASEALTEAGGIVVPVRHDTEGGLARPYITAAMLVDMYADPQALFAKVEGEKNVAFNPDNIERFVDCAAFHVTTCARTAATWDSMPAYQRVVESVMALTIAQIARVPYDTPSGVMLLNHRGRQLFYETQANDWGYLIELPRKAHELGRPVGSCEVDFRYHPAVVGEENGIQRHFFDRKRREQMKLMIERAVALATRHNPLNDTQRAAYATAMQMLSGLHELAER